VRCHTKGADNIFRYAECDDYAPTPSRIYFGGSGWSESPARSTHTVKHGSACVRLRFGCGTVRQLRLQHSRSARFHGCNRFDSSRCWHESGHDLYWCGTRTSPVGTGQRRPDDVAIRATESQRTRNHDHRVRVFRIYGEQIPECLGANKRHGIGHTHLLKLVETNRIVGRLLISFGVSATFRHSRGHI